MLTPRRAITELYLASPFLIAWALSSGENRISAMVSAPAEEATMRRVASTIWKMVFAFLIAGGTITPPLRAQDGVGVDVAIPFAFSVNGLKFPAGTYRLTIEDQFE